MNLREPLNDLKKQNYTIEMQWFKIKVEKQNVYDDDDDEDGDVIYIYIDSFNTWGGP